MTEQQIKQNAVEWADEQKHTNSTIYVARYSAYIAGAHSRDEEIEKLERRIYELHENNAGLTNNSTALSEELNKALIELSNPWISVEERLPDNNQVVLAHHEIIIDGGGEHKEDENVTIQRYVGKWITDRMEQQRMGKWLFDIKDRVTHWMPIPELKKGE